MNREDEYPDDDFYDGDDEPRFSRRKWIGATLAILIVVGFGIGIWYAYDQGVKKGVQLAPPIISADKSPVKVAPEDPGGMEVPNQDKQVFNVLNSTGTPDRVEKLMAPPEQAIPDPKPEVSEAEQAADEDRLDKLVDAATEDGEAAAEKVEEAAETASEKVAETTDKADETAKETAAATSEGATAASEKAEKTVTAALPPAPAATPAPAPKSTATPGGNSWVQVGSFGNREAAEKQWSMLSGKHGALLSGIGYRVQDVEVNGKTYYRLQIGSFGTRDSASKLCDNLKAASQDCLVVSG
ncbi:SPOR domain-containing protein [Sneathiella sp.]|uniref:SPOR domain-containing protein n=1 Tax=Sneathiella sp. TaxID=1964365 RepID=UPI002FE27D50